MGAPPPDDFVRFYNTYEPRLRAFAARRCGASERVDDLVSATMTVAWRRFAEIPTEAEFGWLCGVALRVARNDNRGRRRYVRLLDRAATESVVRPRSTCMETSELLSEQVELLSRAMQALSDDDQDVLRLVAWEGLTSAELSAAINLGEAAARKRLSRARDRLRRAYQSLAADVEHAEGGAS